MSVTARHIDRYIDRKKHTDRVPEVSQAYLYTIGPVDMSYHAGRWQRHRLQSSAESLLTLYSVL